MTRDEGEPPKPDVGWIPPAPDECEEQKYDTPVGDPGDMLRFRQYWGPDSRLVDFAIILMSPLEGRLRRVAEADIHLGELHVHLLNKQEVRIGRENLHPVITQRDVEDAYDMAIDRMMEKWEEYKRRWRNG